MASCTREVVSLQIGHYSNFIGTHWWNIQESTFVYDPSDLHHPKEINHDILFREGKNRLGQVTYTPRLVALDLKGSLHTLKQEGILYDVESLEEDLQWAGDVTLHKLDTGQKNEFLKDLESEEKEDDSASVEEKYEKNEKITEAEEDPDSNPLNQGEDKIFGLKFYDLDDKVNVWSDFLKIYLHPKSVGIVEQYRHGWESEPFDVFGYGQEVYKHHDTRTDIEDRLHFFLEDCDSLQGLHILADTQDGFGGLTSSIVEELNDDYANKAIALYSVSPPSFPSDTISRQCHRAVNSLLSYEQLLSHSSTVVPLSLASSLWRAPGPVRNFPQVNFKSDLLYHTSAILAASLETATTPYRLETNTMLMSHLIDSLTTNGRKMLSLSTTLPVPIRKEQFFVDYLHSLEDKTPWQCLTPACSHNAKPEQQSVVIRGIPENKVKGPPDPSLPHSLNRCKNIDDVMQLYLSDVFSTKLNAICSIAQPLSTSSPYPHIFNRTVAVDGYTEDIHLRQSKLGVTEVPIMTSLQCGSDIKNHLDSLLKECKKFNIAKFHRFKDSGLEEDMYIEAIEKLKQFLENYKETSAYDSESDDD